MDDTTAERLADYVGRYVRRQLLRDGTVHIPGLGTFTVTRTAAQAESASEETTTLHPPEFDLTFTPDA
jgi:nucleoid DNA-binding protein